MEYYFPFTKMFHTFYTNKALPTIVNIHLVKVLGSADMDVINNFTERHSKLQIK